MQPSMFPLPFDAQGNLILTGIHSPDGSWSLDAAGHLVVHDITLNAGPTETAITIHGSDIDPELYNNKARGVIALTQLTGATAAYNGTQILYGRIVIPSFDATRMYRIGAQNIHFNEQSMVTPPRRINSFVYLAWDADATTSSTLLHQHQEKVPNDTSDFDQDMDFNFLYQNLAPAGTDAHLAYFFSCDVNDTAGLQVQGASGTGGSSSQAPAAAIYVEDAGYSFNPLLTFDMGSGTAPPTTHVKTYSANGSASFQEDGTNRAGFDSGHCFQGYYSSTNGNQYSMITFPYATIQSDLSGATITKTELYLNNLHWYNNSGGTAVVGTHNQTSVSGNHAYSQVTDNINQFSGWAVGQAKWVTLNNSIGNAFKNNTAKGIALGKGQTSGGTLSTSHTYYGYFAGNGQTGEPQLRITYTK